MADGRTAHVCMGPTMDQQIIRELFTNTAEAARALGVSPRDFYLWRAAYARGGWEALRPQAGPAPAPRRRSRLTPACEEALDRAFAEAAVVVAVCGSLAEGMPRPFRDYAVAHVREVLRRAIVRAPAVVCLGVGRGGGPRHLARLGYDTPFEDFTLAAAPARPTRRKESP